jgi:hypothetical protein
MSPFTHNQSVTRKHVYRERGKVQVKTYRTNFLAMSTIQDDQNKRAIICLSMDQRGQLATRHTINGSTFPVSTVGERGRSCGVWFEFNHRVYKQECEWKLKLAEIIDRSNF